MFYLGQAYFFGQGVDTNKATTVVSVADLTDTSPGTQYRVTANVGNGEEVLTLKYGENGNYTLISKNGVEYPGNAAFKEDIKVHANDTHAYYSKNDGYKNSVEISFHKTSILFPI